MLGLLASTKKGADILRDFGWESVRHTRTDVWPVIEDVLSGEDGDADIMSSVSSLSLSSRSDGPRGSSMVLPSLRHSDGGPTDHSTSPGTLSGSSPKTGFFLEQGQTWGKPRSGTGDSGGGSGGGDMRSRSRSDTADSIEGKSRSETGSTPVTVGSSRESSPKVSFEGLYEDDEGEENSQENSTSCEKQLELISTKVGRSESEPIQRLNSIDVEEGTHPRSKSDPPRSVLNRLQESPVGGPLIKDQNKVPDKTRTNVDLLLPDPNFTTPEGRVRLTNYQADRSGSNESSRTSKSHTDSLNTDTPTSGISSYDSCPAGGAGDHMPLTPIPSASSMATGSSHNSSFGESAEKPASHPSDSMRRAANLRRVPVQRRYSNPGLGPLSPLKSLSGKRPLSESMIVYATPDDSQGYATLRQLQRQRTLSNEAEADLSSSNVFEDAHVTKTRSLDFRIGKQRYVLELPLNITNIFRG